MTKFNRMLLVASSLAGLAGCATADEAPSNKAEEVDAPMDGKLDGSNIADQGELEWTEGSREGHFALDTSTLSASQRAVSWTFSLVDQATISISLGETRASDRELDTVMYLYQQGASGNWGRYIERNDDTSESNLWSTLSDVQLGEGTFRIVVKGYSNSDRGAFKVGVSCDGAGCVAAEPTDFETGFNEVAASANYMSESDYVPEYLQGEPDRDGSVSISLVRETLGDDIAFFFSNEGEEAVEADALAYTIHSRADAVEFLDDQCVPNENNDAATVAAWSTIRALVAEHLTDVRMLRAGFPDESGDLSSDRGLYVFIIVGKSADGRLMGFLVGSVET
ncbi:MAG: hypothetical protein IPK60_12685 [Sandaracinaceae bacterium]|nr:hypothetical protein [Sandaracinaceae bacterium]